MMREQKNIKIKLTFVDVFLWVHRFFEKISLIIGFNIVMLCPEIDENRRGEQFCTIKIIL